MSYFTRMQAARALLREPIAKAEWSEEDHPRGKTTPESNEGSFAPKEGGGAQTPEERAALREAAYGRITAVAASLRELSAGISGRRGPEGVSAVRQRVGELRKYVGEVAAEVITGYVGGGRIEGRMLEVLGAGRADQETHLLIGRLNSSLMQDAVRLLNTVEVGDRAAASMLLVDLLASNVVAEGKELHAASEYIRRAEAYGDSLLASENPEAASALDMYIGPQSGVFNRYLRDGGDPSEPIGDAQPDPEALYYEYSESDGAMEAYGEGVAEYVRDNLQEAVEEDDEHKAIDEKVEAEVEARVAAEVDVAAMTSPFRIVFEQGGRHYESHPYDAGLRDESQPKVREFLTKFIEARGDLGALKEEGLQRISAAVGEAAKSGSTIVWDEGGYYAGVSVGDGSHTALYGVADITGYLTSEAGGKLDYDDAKALALKLSAAEELLDLTERAEKKGAKFVEEPIVSERLSIAAEEPIRKEVSKKYDAQIEAIEERVRLELEDSDAAREYGNEYQNTYVNEKVSQAMATWRRAGEIGVAPSVIIDMIAERPPTAVPLVLARGAGSGRGMRWDTFEVGDTIELDGFTSSAASPGKAFSGKKVYFVVPEGSHNVLLTTNDSETEVILNHDTKGKVIGMTEDTMLVLYQGSV